jgi:hypothetical protein
MMITQKAVVTVSILDGGDIDRIALDLRDTLTWDALWLSNG